MNVYDLLCSLGIGHLAEEAASYALLCIEKVKSHD